MKAILLLIAFLFYGCRSQQEIKIVEIENTIEVKIEYRTGNNLNSWLYENRQDLETIENVFLVVDKYTKNREITKSIFKYSIKYDVPIGLSLGLAWSESRFDPLAVNGTNNSNGSKDYGLFQLNDRHRRDWRREDFFDIDKNSKEGISFMSEMLERFEGKEVLALGAYNSGATGVRRGVGFTTLVHINNVLDFKQMIEKEINEAMVK